MLGIVDYKDWPLLKVEGHGLASAVNAHDPDGRDRTTIAGMPALRQVVITFQT